MKIVKIIILVLGSISFFQMTQTREMVDGKPKGSYQNSCSECSVADGALHCSCPSNLICGSPEFENAKNNSACLMRTMYYYNDCPDQTDLANCNGTLLCTDQCP